MSRYDEQLARLVELYGTWRAYKEVSATCTLPGFAALTEQRRKMFYDELVRYAKARYGRPLTIDSKAVAMDDVLFRYGQMTLF